MSPTERTRKLPLDPGVVILVGVVALIAYLAYDRGRLRIERSDLIFFAVLIPSIILHEVSHGWVAKAFGDPTADDAGRLTLNPLRHIDRFGTIILPALLLLASAPAFGYAKPVPVNPARMSKNQNMLTSLAGPGVNIVLAVVAGLALRGFGDVRQEPSLVLESLFWFGVANVVLAVFNLIPVPPLDGSAVLERFLPDRYMSGYYTFRRYAMIVLIGLMLVYREGLSALFNPALDLWSKLIV